MSTVELSTDNEIVLVDDNPNNLRLLSNLLIDAGYKVRPTTSGNQALQSIHASPPALILLDIKMPDLDGYEVCERLKQSPETQNIPVIFISALNSSDDRLKGFELGGVDFISKPFHRKEVLSRVKTHISLYNVQHQLAARVEERTAELQETNIALQMAQRIASLGSWEWQLETDQLSLSDEMYQLLDIDPSTPCNKELLFSKIQKDDQIKLQNAINNSIKTQQPFALHLQVLHKNNEARVLYALGEILTDAYDNQVRLFGTVQDITERLKTLEKLEQANTVFESTAEGIVIAAADRSIISVNPAFTEITGYSPEDALGQDLTFRHSAQFGPGFSQSVISSLQQKNQWRGEMWNICKNSKVNPELVTITAVTNSDNEIINYILVFSDISSLKESEEQLEYLAHHDPLTGLPNRLLLNDRIEHAIANASRENKEAALLFLDLDRFKDVNDSFGHTFGDKILKLVAARLLQALRNNDTIARLGGDEFVILAENIKSQQEIEVLAQKILTVFLEPFAPDNHEIFISASIGISLFPSDGNDASTLIRNADTVMYQAKSAGRNTFRFYTKTLTVAATERLQMETALRKSINNNELSLHYQPIVDPKTGYPAHMEALLRWNSRELGNITPDRFIPLAEASSLIIPIGEWVLRTACKHMRALLDAGYDLKKISVNISSLQIQRCNLPQLTAEILHETGLPAKHLDLEITESVLMDDPETVLQALLQLKKLGVSLTVDDFGTGYSSLSYLKRFPIDTLKIDQSFVRDIPHDPNDEAIARAIIAMANSLQMGIVAEGVETELQRDFLLKEKCERAQGFYYSRPLPFDQLRIFLDGLNQSTQLEPLS